MIRTGIKQAAVVYKVRASDKAPLDINDVPISESLRRQAIAVVEGQSNPNPALYEVAFFFPEDTIISGEPTAQYSDDCEVAYITANPKSLTLSAETTSIQVAIQSTAPWVLVQPVSPHATVTPTSGGVGETTITVTRTGAFGSSTINLLSQDFSSPLVIPVVNLESTGWILETGVWRNFKLWKNNGLWKFNP